MGLEKTQTSALSLSYSGASCLQACERKFVLKYVVKAEKDGDYVVPDFFDFGNAFHKILEITKHDFRLYKKQYLEDIVKSYKNLDPFSDTAKIAAMLRVYWQVHMREELRVVACEVKFNTSLSNGIVDAVMVDDKRDIWWIVDLKTTGAPNANLPALIDKDPQMNLYASMRYEIAKLCKLDENRFAGIRYREVTKPRIAPKSGESFAEYSERCDPKIRELVVTVDELDSKETFQEFLSNVCRARELEQLFRTKKELVGTCNYKSCVMYTTPCEYFSWCHGGKTFTKSLERKPNTTDYYEVILPKFLESEKQQTEEIDFNEFA